jgi:uncharacterized spore protein YtfJ
MSLEKIFDVVDKLRSTASADAAFGEPQQVEGRVLIPVACVATGLGVGFGQETPELGQEAQAPRDAEAPGGGGGGGGARSRPVAVIEVTDSETIVRPIVDETIVALAGIALAGWTVFCLLVTIRAVFGKKPQGN